MAQYDLEIQKSKIGGKFTQEKRETFKDEEDTKKPLDVNYDFTKKQAPQISIKPEHFTTTSEMIREIEAMKLGPASHDPNFKLTEKRLDTGIIKIQKDIYQKPEG